MGGTDGRESCGRCSFTTVVDAIEERRDEEDADSATGPTARDPLADGYIEIDERELQLVSAPAIAAGRLKRRLDELAHRVIYGR